MSSFDGNDIGILARPLSIEGVGDDNVFPPDASIQGAKLLIPEWEAPSLEPGESDLLEVWVVAPGSPIEVLIYSNYFPVPVVFPEFVLLDAQYLQQEGDVVLKYRVTIGNENTDTSSPQTFHVMRPTPVNLAEPGFPSATLWGYLNCSSQPKLWERVLVHVPAQPGRFAKDDECALSWEGYASLNGIGPIAGTAVRVTKFLTQEEASSDQGFDLVLGSDKYEQHIKPMERNASALASYTLYRNGRALGKSPPALVRIDRIVPGEALPCGPGATGLDATNSSNPAFADVGNSINNLSMEFVKMTTQVKSGGVLAEPPIIVGQLPDNRLTYQQLVVDKSIVVQLASIEEATGNGGVEIELYLLPKGEALIPRDPTFLVTTKFRADQPNDTWTFPISFTVSTDGNLVDEFESTGAYKAYELAFVIYDVFGNEDTSGPFTEALVDTTAPYQRQPGPSGAKTRPFTLTLGAEFPTTIDDAWMADPANTGGLQLTIPHAYTRFEANNDKVDFYISTQTTFSLMQAETPAYSGPLPADGIITVPLSFLEALNEGVHYYSYSITDLPGNISNNAAITLLFNRVKAPKPILAVPTIPITNGGTVPITLNMVAATPSTVIMEIHHPTHSIPRDRIIPYVYSTEDGPIALAEQEIPPAGTPGPLRFELDYPTLALLFGDPNKDSETELEYYYELERPTIKPNPVSTPSQFAVIDFAYAGPEQPNLPDLENPNIDPVVVQGGGNPLPAPNTLGPAQAGLDAEMEWPVWVDASRPVTGREIVKFFYQGKQVGNPVPVRVGDTTVRTPLPWGTILAEGNGTEAGGDAREAYITIEYPGSANGMIQTPPTKIDVTAIVIDLPVPQIVISAFKGPTGNLVPERIVTSINCPSLDHPAVVDGPKPPYLPRQLRIRIRRDTNIPTGTTVNLEFEGRVNNLPGGAAIPGTQITMTGTMPATGNLEFRLTDYEKIRTIQLPSTVAGQRPPTRYARIAYTAGGIPAEVTVPVALLNSSLVYCEQERP
jgi:hypothetical protein